MLAKKQISLNLFIKHIWFGALKTDFVFFKRSRTLETNAKLKVEPKSLLAQDICLALIIYL